MSSPHDQALNVARLSTVVDAAGTDALLAGEFLGHFSSTRCT
jgi:hypothetical protein